MTKRINTTSADILKADVDDIAANMLAGLIDRHRQAFAAFNQRCEELAEEIAPSAADEDELQKLCAEERAAARDFIAYRPTSIGEVHLKAEYTLVSGDAFTPEDRQGLLFSLLKPSAA
jgi:hypothetical protein